MKKMGCPRIPPKIVMKKTKMTKIIKRLLQFVCNSIRCNQNGNSKTIYKTQVAIHGLRGILRLI